MKLTILGATGSVGQHLVSQALDAGDTVTVLVRTPAKLGPNQDRVTVVQGDVTDVEAMRRAVTGADAVLSALSHTSGSPDDVLTVAATNAITAMPDANVKRLIVLTNIAPTDPGDQPTAGQRLTRGIMDLALRKLNRDHVAQVQRIAASTLDWTIVRATALTKGPQSAGYRVTPLNRTASNSVARANVADFMLTLARDGHYLHAMPVVSQ